MKFNQFEILDTLGCDTDNAVVGSKVKYIGAGDDQVRWGNNDDPRGLLEEGKIYTIETIEVHSWHTKYYLKEFPSKKFNSVSFEAKP